MKRLLRPSTLKLPVGLLLLAALLYFIDPMAVVGQLGRVDLTWLGLAVAATLLAVLVGAGNLFLLVGDGQRQLSLAGFVPLYWVAWSVALVIPGQVGDLFSLPVLLRRFDIHWHTSVGRALIDKVVSLLVMASLAAWGLIYLQPLATEWRLPLSDLLMAVVLAVPVVLALLAWYPGTRGLLARQRHHLTGIGRELMRTMVERPRRVVANFLLTWVKVGLTGLSYWAVFSALGFHDLPYLAVLSLMAASSLVAYLPVSFNGLGTVEFAAILLFGSLGIDSASILAAYLLLRSIAISLAWVPTGFWMLGNGGLPSRHHTPSP